jgi:predicted sulfurtransferase
VENSEVLTLRGSKAGSTGAKSGASHGVTQVIAFYRFVGLNDLPEHRKYFKELCLRLGMKGTILLSPEGINSTVVGSVPSIAEFRATLESHPIWRGLEYKESFCAKVPFTRMLVKLKKEIIPVGDPSIQPAEWTAPRLSPVELKKWLDEGKDFTLVDTRNEYEIAHGTFDQALNLHLDHFREISNKMEGLSEELKSRPVVMFCTGGIRCEKATAVAQQKGFQDLYQLDGGILKYFEQCGGSHYRGNCFVFDYRVAVDQDLRPIDLETVNLQSVNFDPKELEQENR